MLLTVRMRPALRRIIPGRASWQRLNAPVRLTSSIRLPLFRRDVGEQLLLGDARVAHQHIHPAQRLLGGAEGQLTAGPAGHVTLDGQYARQLLLQGCGGLGVGVVKHRHPAARRVECAGCCCADAPVAARDEDGAPLRRRGSAPGALPQIPAPVPVPVCSPAQRRPAFPSFPAPAVRPQPLLPARAGSACAVLSSARRLQGQMSAQIRRCTRVKPSCPTIFGHSASSCQSLCGGKGNSFPHPAGAALCSLFPV